LASYSTFGCPTLRVAAPWCRAHPPAPPPRPRRSRRATTPPEATDPTCTGSCGSCGCCAPTPLAEQLRQRRGDAHRAAWRVLRRQPRPRRRPGASGQRGHPRPSRGRCRRHRRGRGSRTGRHAARARGQRVPEGGARPRAAGGGRRWHPRRVAAASPRGLAHGGAAAGQWQPRVGPGHGPVCAVVRGHGACATIRRRCGRPSKAAATPTPPVRWWAGSWRRGWAVRASPGVACRTRATAGLGRCPRLTGHRHPALGLERSSTACSPDPRECQQRPSGFANTP
jgi:hypothetical protein